MSVKFDSMALVMALAAANGNNYIPYEKFEQVDLIETHGINTHSKNSDNALVRRKQHELLVDETSPMDTLLEVEREEQLALAYKSLSVEARQIINIITTAPKEMADVLFSAKGRPTRLDAIKPRLLTKLAKQWGDRRYAKKVIREIENLVALY